MKKMVHHTRDVQLQQANQTEPEQVFSFDVDSLVDDSLTGSFLYSETLSTLCMFNDGDLYSVDDTDTVQATETKSPFHQSDSGVSDSSSFSPTHDETMLDEIVDNMSSDPFLLTPEVNHDHKHLNLMSSEIGSFASHSQSHTIYPLDLISPGAASENSRRVTRSKSRVLQNSTSRFSNILPRCTALAVSELSNNKKTLAVTSTKPLIPKNWTVSTLCADSDVDSEIDVTDNPSDDSEIDTFRKPRGSVSVSHPGALLPKTKREQSGDCKESSSISSVKIVRIKSSSHVDTVSEVAKAIEDKNRKNAEMAKVNRQKKKAYVESLEQELEERKNQAALLEAKLCTVEAERDDLIKQVDYLKSVLANESLLANILKNVPSVAGVTLSSSVMRKRVAETDHSYTPKRLRHSPAGVCLHVDQGSVSLEFCHLCAQMAHCDDGS